eukprot:jgi/Picsp_1/6390/NSC_03738-R1_beta and beta-prime subunits of dna dependent rna-polymerase
MKRGSLMLLCLLTTVVVVTVSESYPPVDPYANSNSKQFTTFTCNKEFQIVGGVGYEYWRRLDLLYPPLEKYATEAALSFAKARSKNNAVIKACKPSSRDVEKGLVVLNAASSVTGDGNFWTDRFNQFLLQLSIEVPCPRSVMKELKNVKYPKSRYGYIIPLRAYFQEDFPSVEDPPLLIWVGTDVGFSPGVKPLEKSSAPGFPELEEPEQPSNCTCPYGEKTTTKSCTRVPSFEDNPFTCVYVNTTINPDAGLIRWKQGNCTSN